MTTKPVEQLLAFKTSGATSNVPLKMVGGTKITGTGLEHLKGLTSLTNILLHGTKIRGAGLEHVKGLTQLGKLNLRGNPIGAGVTGLQKALPNCKIIP